MKWKRSANTSQILANCFFKKELLYLAKLGKSSKHLKTLGAKIPPFWPFVGFSSGLLSSSGVSLTKTLSSLEWRGNQCFFPNGFDGRKSQGFPNLPTNWPLVKAPIYLFHEYDMKPKQGKLKWTSWVKKTLLNNTNPRFTRSSGCWCFFL